MQQDLVGYLLGALDSPEQDEIRQNLERDSDLRCSLSRLENRLAPLESMRWQYDPPDHLAAATCALVAEQGSRTIPHVFRPEPSAEEPPADMRSRWRWIDMAVAATVLVTFGGLLSPAIFIAGQRARATACGDHLRQLGTALPSWAGRLNGWLPHIPSSGNAGVAGFYAPQLREAQLVDDDSVFLCPGSPLAHERNSFRIPAVAAVFLAKGAQLVHMQQRMGGSYNYGLGYVSDGRLAARCFAGRRHVAVLSDRPSDDGMRGPHGGSSINILFEDGHVRFVRLDQDDSKSGVGWRELFVSDRGEIEAGSSIDDIVLAPSWARPCPQIARVLWSQPAGTMFDWMHQSIDRRALDTGSVLHGSSSKSFMPWYFSE